MVNNKHNSIFVFSHDACLQLKWSHTKHLNYKHVSYEFSNNLARVKAQVHSLSLLPIAVETQDCYLVESSKEKAVRTKH